MTRQPARYAVIHLVVQETLKDLIAPQVIDHMAVQASTSGHNKPERVIVGFLEPMRHAVKSRMRERLRAYRRRAPGVLITLLPYTSRIRESSNARMLGARLRLLTGKLPVVFHCRTESAAEWAVELARYVRPSGIVLDIRGSWPEELLFAQGFDGPEQAPADLQQQYQSADARLRHALAASASILTVSQGMVDYVEGLGASPESVTCVPCCVRSTSFAASERSAVRAQLGLERKLVFTYAGSVTRYQHIEEGLLAFFRLAADHASDSHLLCLTSDVQRMVASIAASGISADRVTLRSASQHDMPGFLAAADAGVLMRAPSRMNRFSQPTKFAEYLAAGLPVVVSRGTGILDAMVEAHGAGLAIDWFEADEDRRRTLVAYTCTQLRACGTQMRAAALALCERQFLWSSYVSAVRSAYAHAIEQ